MDSQIIAKISLAIGGIFGLIFFRKTTDWFARLILIGMIAAVGIKLLPKFETSYTIAYTLYGFMVLLTTIYTFVRRDFKSSKRMLILVITIPVLFTVIMELQHWPGKGLFVILMPVSIVVFAYLFVKRRDEFQNEMGILGIMISDAFYQTGSWIFNMLTN